MLGIQKQTLFAYSLFTAVGLQHYLNSLSYEIYFLESGLQEYIETTASNVLDYTFFFFLEEKYQHLIVILNTLLSDCQCSPTEDIKRKQHCPVLFN